MRARTGGFTLIEIIVSVVLFAVIANAALNLLMSQRKLTDTATASISLQTNVRAAVDLVASELRAVPDGSVLAGNSDSVVVRFPYRWGLVCASSGAGSPAPDADVFMPTTDALFADMVQTGVAVRDTSGTWTYWDDTTEPWEDSLYVESAVTCLKGAGAPVQAGDTAEARYRRWSGYQSYTGSEANPGDQVIAYGVVTYRFGDSVFEPGVRALFRVTSAGEQELAGFFADDAGFAYILKNGNVYTTLPVGQEEDVAQVRILARASVVSQAGGGDGRLTYDATLNVHLRNTGSAP